VGRYGVGDEYVRLWSLVNRAEEERKEFVECDETLQKY
jgi:hypothetical protein